MTYPDRCPDKGPTDAWRPDQHRYRRTPVNQPRCNRPAGHEGSHRTYDKMANVRAEWSTADAV